MNKSFSVFVCIIFLSFSLLIFDNASSQSVEQDDCPNIEGNSTNDRVGCLDSDGDGWSNSDENWTVNDGAYAFENDKTQWKDLDKDGFGDNSDKYPKDASRYSDPVQNIENTDPLGEGTLDMALPFIVLVGAVYFVFKFFRR